MKRFQAVVASLLAVSLSATAYAQEAGSGGPKPAETQTSLARPATVRGPSSRKATMLAGTALFVGGFTVGAYSFINNSNGAYAEFGEASARNVKLGSAGLGVAFAGGVLMFLGSHARHMPSVSAGPGSLTLTKHVSW